MKSLSSVVQLSTLLVSVVFVILSFALPPLYLSTFPTVSAREDEDKEDEEGHNEDDEEDEEDKDEDEEDERPKTSKPKTIQVVKEVIEYKPVTETIIVTEAAYTIDTDGDVLVDAIDPDPLVPQSEYFTDIDNDGVPNALDLYHDEDDFSYYEFETDDDNNGILDSYEQI